MAENSKPENQTKPLKASTNVVKDSNTKSRTPEVKPKTAPRATRPVEKKVIFPFSIIRNAMYHCKLQ